MEKLIYVKFSEDRAPEFCIKTQIMAEGEKRTIYKSGIDRAITEHLRRMPDRYQWLTERYCNVNVWVNEVRESLEGMEFPFVHGESLQTHLDHYLAQKDYQRVQELICEYTEKLLLEKAYTGDFSPNEEESRIFGDIVLEDVKLAQVSNIDMIFSNILIDEKGWHLIDYEWTYNFPVPQKFILYRALLYWKHTSNVLEDYALEDVLSWGHITQEEAKIFSDMEIAFQKYVAGDKETFRTKAYEDCKTSYSINDINQYIIEKEKSNDKLHVYFPIGHAYREDHARDFYRHITASGNRVFDIELEEAYSEIRLDPVENPCVVVIKELTLAKTPITYRHNGIQLGENMIGFEHCDPQIILQTEGRQGTLRIDYTVYVNRKDGRLRRLVEYERSLRDEEQQQISKLDEQIAGLKETCSVQQSMIKAFEPTVWYKMFCFMEKVKRHVKK